MIKENSLIHSDCLDIMCDIPDKSIDLVLTDPNYGIKQDGRNNHTRDCLATSKDYSNNIKYDNDSPSKVYFNELFRISKNQIVFGANHFISKMPYDSSCWIVWDKDNGKTDFADCELAWTSFKTAVRKFKYKWQGMLQEDMKNKDILVHPNQKPLSLMLWLLKNYSKENDLIFDGFAGSGTTALACIELNRHFICVEKDFDYYNIAKKRIDDAKSQLKLF
jgi:site-specific DNA-methyltransferase (adenine-specific)